MLLPIDDLAHLFNPSPVNPSARGLPEVLGISGAEYLITLLQSRWPVEVETLNLVLPQSAVVTGVAEEVQRAIGRFAECRIDEQQRALREIRRRGWRVAGIALVVLALFLALASLFASDLTSFMPTVIRRTLEYGFEIAGWVMLWRPIEMLLLDPMEMKDTLAALRKLAGLKVVVSAEAAQS